MKEIFKKEPVLTVASLLASVSAFIIHPSIQYMEYIDFRVLTLLFCLMLVVGGMQTLGVFEAINSLHGKSDFLSLLCKKRKKQIQENI